VQDPDKSPIQKYFCRSIFRNPSFVVTTLILVAFVWRGINRGAAIEAVHPCASRAIGGLTLIPVVVWAFSLWLFFEVRLLTETAVDVPKFSRLDKLHAGLTLVVTSLALTTIETLFMFCPKG
jgi:hypothetical protein